MKFTDLLKSASSNLLRNKGRTILTIIAIFIGAFTIALTTGVNIGVNDYIDTQVGNVGGENQLIVQAKSESTSTDSDEPNKYDPDKQTNAYQQSLLNDKDLEKIGEVKGIESVEPMESASVDYIEGENGDKFVFSGATMPEEITVDLEAGEPLSSSTSDYEIDLAPEYVKALGYNSSNDALGKTVKLGVSSGENEQEVVEAKIVGVRNKSLIQAGQSLLNQPLNEQLVSINKKGLPEAMVNTYYAAYAQAPKGSTKSELSTIKTRLSDAGYTGSTVEDQIGMIKNVINAITSVLIIFGAIALLAASFGIINTLYMSVQERTREIGLMKAMGLSSGKVFMVFSVEAALIGFFGSVLGILAAMGAGALINQAASNSFLSELPGLKLIQFSLPSSIVIILIIMLIAFLAGTLPARKAAKLDPIESLRYE